jgi:glycosyltransferase involved in cell wall biosynthesis
MHITIDVSSIPYGTGVSRYTANLTRALASLPGVTLTLFGSALRQNSALRNFADTIKLSPHLLPLPPTLTGRLFNSAWFPSRLLIPPSDVFHTWDWYLPSHLNQPVVMTVHDLSLFRYPKTGHTNIKRQHLQALLKAHRQKVHLIAVSQTTKQDLIDLFHFPAGQITLIPEALPSESKIKPTREAIIRFKQAQGLSKPYLLFVGTKEPRKNLPRIIQAWQAHRHTVDLVLVGNPAWQDLPTYPGLHTLGYLSGEDLAAAYRGAEILLITSLYEGFGLPILEAFYHRLPVVTADISAMPEVAGDAAVTVNPLNVEAISLGIATARKHRHLLIQKGLSRLKHFSWEKTARATLKVYQQAINHYET